MKTYWLIASLLVLCPRAKAQSTQSNLLAHPATQSTPAATEAKQSGLAYSLGYTTFVPDLGSANGLTTSAGFYFLNRSRKIGGLLDFDALYYFEKGAPKYYLLSFNGILRPTETSKFYIGGGVGYALASVELIDRYGLKTTVSNGDLGGKAFMGYGLFRVGMIAPSLQAIESGGLLTVGLFTNPFK